MEIKEVKIIQIGNLTCPGCGTTIKQLGTFAKLVTGDGTELFSCEDCGRKLANMFGVEVVTMKLNTDECQTCLLKFKCFTERSPKKKRGEQ